MAASAAYWVASQASEIVATPGGDVGSIGVYSMHQDISQALAAEGVTTTLVHAGEFKIEGNPFSPLEAVAREHLQARVDQAYGQFVLAVASGRGVKPAEVEADYGRGRLVGAREALAAGMIDRIETFDATLARYARPASGVDYSRRAKAAAAKAAV
jgi:ClpP class serine protease